MSPHKFTYSIPFKNLMLPRNTFSITQGIWIVENKVRCFSRMSNIWLGVFKFRMGSSGMTCKGIVAAKFSKLYACKRRARTICWLKKGWVLCL